MSRPASVGTLYRVLSGIVFVPILILLSNLGGSAFLMLFNVILVLACREFYQLMEFKGVNPSKKVGIAAALILSTLVYWRGGEFLGFFFAAFVIVIALRELFRTKVAFPIYDMATTVFGVIYVGWLLVHLLLLRELPREVAITYETGSAMLLFAFLLAWSSDTGAYFVGMAIGRHKLFPRVSPSKSVEGAIAGFAATLVAAVAGRTWLVLDPSGAPLLTVAQALALGVIVGVANQLGDLVESLLKRDAAVKDTSEMIPGHGGVLDRFDSLLFAGPVTYYFLLWVVFA